MHKTYAQDFIKRIISEIEKLTFFPELGRIVPELNNPHIREIIYHNYRIVYKLKNDTAFISIVCHGSFDLNEQLKAMDK